MIGSQQIGLVRNATVKSVDYNKGTMLISIDMAKSDSSNRDYSIPIPASWAGPSGEFAGGAPVPGSTIKVSQGQGGLWSPLSYVPSTDTFGNNNTKASSGFRNNIMSALRPGRHVIQVKNNIRHITDPDIGLQFGSPDQFVHADPKAGINSSVFNSSMNFTEAHRDVTGPILRDTQSNSTRGISGSTLTSHAYNASLKGVGLDTRTRPGDSFARNPLFNESRQIVYEFANSFGFTDDVSEKSIYDGEVILEDDTFVNRRVSRADALSLSLIEPNYLIESIAGTVVDIYGNIVDLNRALLPNGLLDSLSFRNIEVNASDTFTKLREQSRKSIAYHWELNARKPVPPDLNNLSTYLDNTNDYARSRSKFFVDIDKEGQFRMNVPASSEVGNIGLTVRHENYSSIAASANDTDPRAFIRNVDNQDIFLDSFGKGAVTLSGGSDGNLDGFAAPTDRVRGNPIKLGTTFHDITNTLTLHSLPEGKVPVPLYPDSKLNFLPKVTQTFSPDIIVSGDDANAGGRSGTITLDGMLSLSIGANTIDRQSMWLDCAGGIVSNIGRDINDISYAGKFDGDILIQIGGATIGDDTRFNHLNNAYRSGSFDLRIAAGNMVHILRFDESGLRIYTPGEIDMVAEGHIKMESRKGNMYLNAEGIYLYANDRDTGRLVARTPGRTIR